MDVIKKSYIEDVTLSILPSKFYHGFKSKELHNHLYLFWSQFWKEQFQKKGSEKTFSPDCFYRQDYILCLHIKNQIVGTHLCSVFDLDSQASLGNPFLKSFSPEQIHHLRERNLRKFISWEYLTVNPQFGSIKWRVPWGDVLIAMGIFLVQEKSYDGALGMPIASANVEKMGKRFGAYTLGAPVNRYNFSCIPMVFEREFVGVVREHSFFHLMNRIWENRRDEVNNNSYLQEAPLAA